MKKLLEEHLLAVITILLGSLSWLLTMIKSGLIYPFGMGFWGPNGHDGVWHIALVESLSRGSREMPVFSGETLKNYHIGFDLLVALLSRVTGIIPGNLYFQIIPPILAVLIGFLVYKLVLIWQESKTRAAWALFFTYFAGNLGWIVTLFRDEKLGGESMFWSQQAVSTLINPPFAMSLVLILLGMIFMIEYQNKPSVKHLALGALCFGVLVQVKAYAGILVLCSLLITGVFELVTRRRLLIIRFFGASLVISLPLIIITRTSGFPFIWQPFWFLETMMGLTDRLGWLRFYSAMTNYRLGGLWIKATLAYLVAFVIFLVGNMGTRALAFGHLLPVVGKRRLSTFDVFVWVIIIGGVAIPMFFLQKGTPWNTIQFFYYSLFFSGILAGVAMGAAISAPHRKTYMIYIIEVIVVLLTVPATIGTLYFHYLPARPPAMISKTELEAIAFLRRMPFGIVLTYPFDKTAAKKAELSPPRPLYLYESTAYIAAFSGKSTFLEDEVNLDITGFDWRERRMKVETFYETSVAEEARNFLSSNKIKYVYWLKGQRARLAEGELGLNKVFENQEVDIYEVRNVEEVFH